jgi:hypothetical protein
MTLFALLAMVTAASAFATAAVSGAYERRYLRHLARKTAAAVGAAQFRLSMFAAAPRHIFQLANKILMLGMLWSGFAACAFGALAYDIALWLGR